MLCAVAPPVLRVLGQKSKAAHKQSVVYKYGIMASLTVEDLGKTNRDLLRIPYIKAPSIFAAPTFAPLTPEEEQRPAKQVKMSYYVGWTCMESRAKPACTNCSACPSMPNEDKQRPHATPRSWHYVPNSIHIYIYNRLEGFVVPRTKPLYSYSILRVKPYIDTCRARRKKNA